MKFSVYILTFPDGRKYIGFTSRSTKERWHNGYGYKSNRDMDAEIRKVGWSNIKHEVFFETGDVELAKACERVLIAKYETTNPMKGFNKSIGETIMNVPCGTILELMIELSEIKADIRYLRDEFDEIKEGV